MLTDKMASIRRTDIMHKSFSKGRPAKTERERNKRRQEAYRWRDARRIYLANSFDKWRKLRSSLGLKDSGLAWHLMEAHEKGQCGICRRKSETNESEQKALTSVTQTQDFLSSLITSLQRLCHSHFQFEECIKIVGLFCLEFDNVRKENFSVNETITAKSLPKTGCKDQIKSCTEVPHLSLPPPKSTQVNEIAFCQNTSSDTALEQCNITDAGSVETCTKTADIDLHRESSEEHNGVNQETSVLECQQSSDEGSSKDESVQQPTDQTSLQNANLDFKTPNETPITFSQNSDSCINACGLGVTGENSNKIVKIEQMTGVMEDTQPSSEHSVHLLPKDQSNNQSPMNWERQIDEPLLSVEHVRSSNSFNESISNPKGVNSTAVLKSEPGADTLLTGQCASFSTASVELPLDMSLIKTEPSGNETIAQIPQVEHTEKQPTILAYPKVKMKDSASTLSGLSAVREDSFNKSRCRSKEESSPSIPWQRRDMSRKEEYEFLELNPFSDLAEFSLRYPHVHQRTYYRWKRRIKEEYIILEQCPEMTFEQFSSVVLQAKETVFNLWKGLISQGKGFFAPSADASSKRVETKSSGTKSVNNFSAEYLYLQKNLSVTQEQFCRKYPNISADIFNVLKRKVMQEFWVFYQNKQMSWKDFSKLLSISEDVYNCWREYVESMRQSSLSPDMKAVLGEFMPNARMFSSTFSPFLESPSSPTDSSSQIPKESLPNTVNDPFTSQTMQLDSALKNSVSRSLSASYLSSLQNMMLPWASYYNIAPPLSQQMLPMMLWPRMLGLGLAGPMNINSLVSASSAVTSASSSSPSLDVLANVSREAFSSPAIKDHAKSDSDNFLPPKVDMRSSKLNSGKRPSAENVQENDNICEGDGFKKQRVKEDWDGGSTLYSRSRKQNKQEYIYYLKNPELCFKDLETLFPAISVRTFYRWRKEMNAAVFFIEDNKTLDYQQFKLVFPDIPEDVFDSWKSKSGKMSASKSENMFNIHDSSVSKENQSLVGAEDSVGYFNVGAKHFNDMSDAAFHQESKLSADGELSQSLNACQEAHIFIHQNPDTDFATFTQMFPDISAHLFSRWKKEWKDATEFIQANPDISYETYKSIDASVPREIFESWKVSVFSNEENVGAKGNDVSEDNKKEFKSNSHCNRKHNGPEFVYLQLNPYIDFSQFSQIYPEVPSRTFYRWKREIQQILSYVRAQPTISFSELSAILPDISEEAFLKWKELTQEGAEIYNVTEKRVCPTDTASQMEEETKTKMTKALLHLMHNPNMTYIDFHHIFDFVSPETFQLWLHRIKLVVLHISSNPSLNYAEFSSAITDIGEDVFMRWKSLTPEEISSIGTQSQDCPEMSGTFENSTNSDIKEAVFYCQKFPDVTYDVFSCKFPNISNSQFKQWMLKISDQIAFIKDNPGLTFEDFHKVFEDVRETVFESWKEKPFPQNPILHADIMEVQEKDTISFNQATRSDEFGVEFVPSSDEVKSSRAKGSFCNDNTLDTQPVSTETSFSNLGQTGNGKENEGVSSESSLSKLTKFAESDVSLYTRWTPGNLPEQDKFSDHSDKSLTEHGTSSLHGENSPLLETYKSQLENDIDNNNVRFNGLYNASLPRSTNVSAGVNKLLNPLSSNISVTEVGSLSPELSKSPLKYDHDIDDYNTTGQKHLLPSENKSLSALMVMSANKTHPPAQLPNFKLDMSNSKSSHSCTSGSWNPTHVNSKEEDEIFSSQRQKKMSRAEYLFVKDNPDVDSQEFARIFPGVSARTFYRWKKEIKAQIQIP